MDVKLLTLIFKLKRLKKKNRENVTTVTVTSSTLIFILKGLRHADQRKQQMLDKTKRSKQGELVPGFLSWSCW
jgi:hypothetical protein